MKVEVDVTSCYDCPHKIGYIFTLKKECRLTKADIADYSISQTVHPDCPFTKCRVLINGEWVEPSKEFKDAVDEINRSLKCK